MAQAFTADLERFSISLPMWRVLAALLGEREMRLGDLARRTSIEMSTLSRISVAMEERGLIVRRRSGRDARAVLASLTPAGLEMVETIVPLAQERERRAVSGLSADEISQLKAMLVRIHANVTETAGR
ncbi:MAG: MarR family winged helix-turn-helix transcriptional regulator [Actinomycetota bacterium]